MIKKEEFEKWAAYESIKRLRDWLAQKAGGERFMSEGTFTVYLISIRYFCSFLGFEKALAQEGSR